MEEISTNPVYIKNRRIDAEIKFLRSLCLVLIVVAILISGASFWYVDYSRKEDRKYIYVLDNGNSLILAYRKLSTDNRPAEMKNHAKMIIDRIFTISTDRGFIEQNISEVKNLGDGSIIKFIDNLIEKKYYDNMIAASVTQVVEYELNDISLELNKYPYGVTVRAKLKATRRSSVTVYQVGFSMHLRNVPRSDDNPHGLLAEDFTLTEQKEIEVYDREKI